MSNYSSIYKLLKSIDNADTNTGGVSGIDPFSSGMLDTGVTFYSSSTNKLLTASGLTYSGGILTVPTLTASTSITTPNLTASTSITTPNLTASTAITTPNLTASTAITTSGLTILNNDINITGISSSSTRRLKIVGSTSHNLSFGFDFGNFLPAETGNKSFDFYKYSFTSGECTLCIYNPDNAGTTIRHKLSANSGKNSFLCNDSTSQLVVGSGTSTSNYALLQLQSTTKGLLLPRLTDTQITTLQSGCTSTETGLTIYDSTNLAMKVFNGSTFQTVGATSNTSIPWSTGVPLTIGAVTTSPGKGSTFDDFIQWRLLNSGDKEYEIQARLIKTANTSTSGGSGDYLFQLPNSLTFHSTKQTLSTGNGGPAFQSSIISSSGYASFPSASVDNRLIIVPYNSTQFRLLMLGYGTFIGSSSFALGNASLPLIYCFTFKFFAA